MMGGFLCGLDESVYKTGINSLVPLTAVEAAFNHKLLFGSVLWGRRVSLQNNAQFCHIH